MRVFIPSLLTVELFCFGTSKSGIVEKRFLHSTRLMSAGRTLVDFDANLCHTALKEDLAHHIKQGQEYAHISHFVVPGATLMESEECLRLSEEKGSSIIATAGVHPYHVGDPDDLLTSENEMLFEHLYHASHVRQWGRQV